MKPRSSAKRKRITAIVTPAPPPGAARAPRPGARRDSCAARRGDLGSGTAPCRATAARPRRPRPRARAGRAAARAQHVLDQALDGPLLPAVVLRRLGEARPQPGEVELLAEPIVASGRRLGIDAGRARP